ncbi:protein FAM78A [Puma concolor]|uniref:Protein FAM78A n=1 Tax=Puma concolor TaxID=9696 RepID=A0A6P6H1J3_PUMCO|nr:protein FAM78A [Puma concolor]
MRASANGATGEADESTAAASLPRGLGYLNLPMAHSPGLEESGKCSPPAALAQRPPDAGPELTPALTRFPRSSAAWTRNMTIVTGVTARTAGARDSYSRSSWELPDLQEGKIEAISDSDGVNYPWYGNTTETCTIVGPTKRDSKFIISMNDNFYPSVTWAVPVSESNVAKLTNIYRDQSFTTWLVATNTSTNDMIILQTLHWRMQLSIEVNPNRPLGQRARLREPIAQDQPKILSKNEPIPPSALVKPNANDAQVLMWRPKYGQPLVVIPPKHR